MTKGNPCHTIEIHTYDTWLLHNWFAYQKQVDDEMRSVTHFSWRNYFLIQAGFFHLNFSTAFKPGTPIETVLKKIRLV